MLLASVTDVNFSKAALLNPVMCITLGDSMLFTITDPNHYPVYLKDSIMNSNPKFDYGQFLILADQMNTNIVNNVTTPSLFAFTFGIQGSYVFVDSADSEQLMIIRVTGAGESCPDPDRYIQPMSGETAASSGISQKADIILKPDVPLLVGMGSVLVVSIVTVMIGVGYCLHKGWRLPKMTKNGYRKLNMKEDIDHTSVDTFEKDNDFTHFKSHLKQQDDKLGLLDSEDDLDDINLNIHHDVLNAGQEYLKIFGDKKQARVVEKTQRKGDIVRMISEIEQLINVIG